MGFGDETHTPEKTVGVGRKVHGCAEFIGEARGFEKGHLVSALAQEYCCAEAADAGTAYRYLEGLDGFVVAVDTICVTIGAVCEVHDGCWQRGALKKVCESQLQSTRKWK
jgi:hypothetical protein